MDHLSYSCIRLALNYEMLWIVFWGGN